MKYTAAVIAVSDMGSRGLRQDTSGLAVRAMLEEAGFSVAHTAILPDEMEQIRAELRDCADRRRIDLIVTTGGTGLSSRDVTPEATRAMLSRAMAGIRGSSLLLNLPGSEKAARENLAAVIGALEHGLHMIAAEGHK